MSNMVIKVEFLAGTEIKSAVYQAKAMAIKLGVAYIEFDFNGVSVSVGQSCDEHEAMNEWKSCDGIKSKYGYVFN